MGLPVEKFLLTPLREGRRQPAGGTPDRRNISTHAPAGGATSKTECVHQARNISTHAPAGGATISNGSRSWPRRFLLTPLREGRLNRIVIALMQELISTHAPAGGATADLRRCWKHRPHFYSRPCGRGDQMSGLRFESMAISTHAPAGGATSACATRASTEALFLLTPLREGRRRVRRMDKLIWYISTHAPAGGATVYTVSDGADKKFLLTPLREGRQTKGATSMSRKPFLLTPLREGRPMPNWSLISPRIFLLTPLREGRLSRSQPTLSAKMHFYSRPCGRGDAGAGTRKGHKKNFYSRPCGRGDCCEIFPLRTSFSFLLTPLREGRRKPPPKFT